MTNRPLKVILADLADNMETSHRDLDSLPASVRPGHAGAVRRAQEAIPVLKKEYGDTLFSNSLAFFVEGGTAEAREQFAEIAYEEGALPADFGVMYAGLADQIEPQVPRSKEFGLDQTVSLDYLLRGIATRSGFGRAVDLPRTTATNTVPDKESLAKHLRKLAETTVDGSKLNVLVTTQKLVEAAAAHRFIKKVFPFVVLNASEADRKLLQAMATKSMTVDLTGVATIDPGFVIGVFKEARNETPPKAQTPPPAPPAPDANA